VAQYWGDVGSTPGETLFDKLVEGGDDALWARAWRNCTTKRCTHPRRLEREET
jgi:hypothetical protein